LVAKTRTTKTRTTRLMEMSPWKRRTSPSRQHTPSRVVRSARSASPFQLKCPNWMQLPSVGELRKWIEQYQVILGDTSTAKLASLGVPWITTFIINRVGRDRP
jgi:hypothetical protein